MGVVTEESKDPIRLLTMGYVLALLIIALMSVCIHVVIDEVVEEQNNVLIVVSSRQAQLSQRIAFYASQYVEEKDALYKEQLEEAIALMRSSHETLVRGNKEMNISTKMPPEIKRIYFSLPYNLDKKVTDFLDHSQAFLEEPESRLSRNNEHYRYIIGMAKGPLTAALDAAIMRYEADSEERIGKLQSYQRIALFVIFAMLLAEAALIFRPLVSRVYNYAKDLKKMALADPLTGIDNKRSFTVKGLKALRSSSRHEYALTICMMDIDHFKNVNDTHGHQAGDAVLQAFVEIVKRCLRLEDEFARVGGEEFAALLPHTTLDAARIVAERIREMVEVTPIRCPGCDDLFITVSIGLAEADPRAPNLDSVLNEADKALYKAKKMGRNKVVLSESHGSGGKVVKLEQPS